MLSVSLSCCGPSTSQPFLPDLPTLSQRPSSEAALVFALCYQQPCYSLPLFPDVYLSAL